MMSNVNQEPVTFNIQCYFNTFNILLFTAEFNIIHSASMLISKKKKKKNVHKTFVYHNVVVRYAAYISFNSFDGQENVSLSI